MIALRLIAPDARNRADLIAAFESDPELCVAAGGDDAWDVTGHSELGADVIVVDLPNPKAFEPAFWARIHVLFPGVRLMAVVDEPVATMVLRAALVAGAYYVVARGDAPERLCSVARAATYADGFIPRGAVIMAMADIFSDWGLAPIGLRLGELCLVPAQRLIRRGTTAISLTRLEFDLLLYLVSNAGHVFPPVDLARVIWHEAPGYAGKYQYIKAAIQRLRQKIEADPSKPRFILTRRGHGYYVAAGSVELG